MITPEEIGEVETWAARLENWSDHLQIPITREHVRDLAAMLRRLSRSTSSGERERVADALTERAHYLTATFNEEVDLCVRDMRKAAALLRQPVTGAEGWLPIESAPRDGTHILIPHGDHWTDCRWFDRWEYDHRYPEAKDHGGWVIGGGHVVTPKVWRPQPQEARMHIETARNIIGDAANTLREARAASSPARSAEPQMSEEDKEYWRKRNQEFLAIDDDGGLLD